MNPAPHPITTPIGLDHIEGFHRALDVVARERRYLMFLEAPPLQVTRDFVTDNLRVGNPQWVALVEGEVVGWCDIRKGDRPVTAHRGTLGMGIVPAWRGRGLGTQLIGAALEQARSAGLVRIELQVYTDNVRAIALYEKVGFRKEGVLRAASLIDGRFLDAVSMALLYDREEI